MNDIGWIGVDWGTSNVRAYLVGADNALLEKRCSTKGAGLLQSNEFEPVLMSLIGDWLPLGQTVPVYACGMVGGRQGWIEACYSQVPCRPVSLFELTHAPASSSLINVNIIPGLSQQSPFDVMRGEETQIAGYLSEKPQFSGYICLPGSHSKWALIAEGKVISFNTYLTGEMFNALSNHTLLRFSVSDSEFCEQSFIDEAKVAVANPALVMGRLFGIRAEQLLYDSKPGRGRARLSGMLLGQEIGAARDLWKNGKVAVIGEGAVAEMYYNILKNEACDVNMMNADEATVAGLGIVAQQLRELSDYA